MKKIDHTPARKQARNRKTSLRRAGVNGEGRSQSAPPADGKAPSKSVELLKLAVVRLELLALDAESAARNVANPESGVGNNPLLFRLRAAAFHLASAVVRYDAECGTELPEVKKPWHAGPFWPVYRVLHKSILESDDGAADAASSSAPWAGQIAASYRCDGAALRYAASVLLRQEIPTELEVGDFGRKEGGK